MLKYLRKMLYFYINIFFATFFASPSLPEKKSLAIVFDEHIGDYILFRNSLQAIKESKKYSDYQITFICSNDCKELAEFLDLKYVYKFIWIDIEKFKKHSFYRYKWLYYFSKQNFTEVLIPSESRNLISSDLIALALQAKTKTTFITSNRNIPQNKWNMRQKEITTSWYTNLYEVDYDKSNFAFDIRKRLISKIIEEPVRYTKPEIYLPNEYSPHIKIDEQYIVLAIGASDIKRQWPTTHVSALMKFILENTPYSIVLTGNKQERNTSLKIQKSIAENLQNRIKNICGETSLKDLLYILNKATIVIGNDSGTIHIAMALNNKENQKKVIVLFPGKCFTRFVPYPQNMTNNYWVITSKRFKESEVKYDYFLNISDIYPMEEITVNQVIEKIKAIL